MSSASAAAAAVLAEVVLDGLGEQDRRAATDKIVSRLRNNTSDSTLSTAHLVAQIVQRYPDAAVSKTLEDSLVNTLDCKCVQVTDRLAIFHQVAELIIDYPNTTHGFLGRISQYLLLAVQALSLPKDGDSPGFAVPTLDFLERFCHYQTDTANASKFGCNEFDAAKKYLEFLKVLFWSSKKGSLAVDTSLLCTLIALLGAADTTIAHAARDAIQVILAGRLLPNAPKLLPEVIWHRILNLTSESKKVDYIDSAFSIWAYWISLPEPLRPSQSLLAGHSYWDLLRSGLETGYSGRRKQCLYILVNSPALVEDQTAIAQPTIGIGKTRVPQILWTTYSTIFKIIVLDRAVNQIVDALSQFRSLLQCGSGFPRGFITVLLASSLLPAMSDGVRKIVGNFVLELEVEELAFLENEQSFITDSLLPYAVNGSLFTSSIQWQKPLAHCEHGQKVSGFLRRLIFGFSAESKAAHSRAILEFLHAKRDLIFAPARACVLQGLRDGLGGEACLDVHDAALIGQISAFTGYSELFRDIYKTLCLDLYLCIKQSLIVDHMGFLDQVASSIANCEHIVSEKQIRSYAAYLDPDVILKYLDRAVPSDENSKVLSASVLCDAFLIHVQACWGPKPIYSWIPTSRAAELVSVLLRYDIQTTRKLVDQELLGTLLDSVLGYGKNIVPELESSGRLPDIVEYLGRIQNYGVHDLKGNVRDVVSEVCLRLTAQEFKESTENTAIDGDRTSESTMLSRLGVCAAFARLRLSDSPIQRLTIDWIFEHFRNMQDLNFDANLNTKEQLQVRDASLAAQFSLLQSVIRAQHAKRESLDIHSLSESILHIISPRYMQEKALLSLLHCLTYIIDIDHSSSLLAPTARALVEYLMVATDFLDYPKDILIILPSVTLHARIISLCVEDKSLSTLISKNLRSLAEMAAGKPYLFPAISKSIRRCFWHCPEKFCLWKPLEDAVFDIVNKPPIPHLEFQLEFATAMLLETENPRLIYNRYYGEKDGVGFAGIFDILNRLGPTGEQFVFGRRILDRILDPWMSQKEPIPIVSKWKRTSQLQAILILVKQQFVEVEICDEYLDKFLRIVSKEPNPRYRFLLEWIASLVVLQAPEIRSKLSRALSTTDHSNPKYLASLLKVMLMTAPHVQESSREGYLLDLTRLVVPMATSPKILLRHEAQRTILSVWMSAKKWNYSSITEDPIMQQLHAYTASTRENPRVNHFDPVENYNLETIFQGEYLNMNPPDAKLVGVEDFAAVRLNAAGVKIPNSRVTLGAKIGLSVTTEESRLLDKQPPRSSKAPLQTKAVTWQPQELSLDPALHGHTQGRPFEVIVIASPIDNYFNIGGLSRVCEIFGTKSLHINRLDILKTQQFTSVSVSSDVWLPIEELTVPDIPQFLREKRLEGYSIIGIEQTDRSKVLGQGDWKLPRKTVLLLGSEREGIPALLLSEMDLCVEIPQKGQTRSMNVQTAAAVVLYEYTRQHG